MLRLSLLAMIITILAPALRSERVRPVRTVSEACDDIRASGPEAIEGVWRLTAPDAEGALIAIERDGLAGEYIVTTLEAPDLSLLPGSLIGRVTRGAQRGVYDAWLYADAPLPGAKVGTRRKFTLRLSDDGTRLEFSPRRSPLAFNFRISIPYLFFHPGVRNVRHADPTPQGAERVFPIPYPPIEPIYL